nr:hypothetical protein GACBDANE_00072 [Spodoptera litura nucleopolyhedrovirus]
MNQHFKSKGDIFVGPLIFDDDDVSLDIDEMSDDIITLKVNNGLDDGDIDTSPSILNTFNLNLLCDEVQVIEPAIDVIDVSDEETTAFLPKRIKTEENTDGSKFMHNKFKLEDFDGDHYGGGGGDGIIKYTDLFNIEFIEKLESESNETVCIKCADVNSTAAYCRCPMTDEKMKILQIKMISSKFVHRVCLLNVISKADDLKKLFKPIDVKRVADEELKAIAKIHTRWYRPEFNVENTKVFFQKLPESREKLENLVDNIYRNHYDILLKNFNLHKEELKFMYYIKSICNVADEYNIQQWLDIFNFSTWSKLTLYRFYSFINVSKVKTINCYNCDQLKNVIFQRLRIIKMSKDIFIFCCKRAQILFVKI